MRAVGRPLAITNIVRNQGPAPAGAFTVRFYLSADANLDASNPSVHLGLGLLAEERGQLNESRRHLLRAHRSPLTRQRASARLAVVCGRLGEKEAAAQFSERAAALPPDSRWIDPYLAECLQLAVDKSNVFQRVEHSSRNKNRRPVRPRRHGRRDLG